MICLMCRHFEVVDRLTLVHFERGEMKLVINLVPARVCPGCREAYVEEDVAARLLQFAEATYAAGEKDFVINYRENHI